MEALSLEVASAGQQSVSAPRQQKHPSLKDVWRVAWTNCAWVQALWRDLLCVGFAKQLWKVYVHDMPKVWPSFCMLLHCLLLSGSDIAVSQDVMQVACLGLIQSHNWCPPCMHIDTASSG